MITDEQLITVTPESWLDVCSRLAEDGLRAVDWISAVDREDGLDVIACLVNPGSIECALVSCRVDHDHPRMPSVASLFTGADWHERETAEMFGVEFIGRASTEPLLLRHSHQPPLRKSVALEARVQTPWPGAEPDSGRRRRKLPPGVRQEWIADGQ